MRKVLKEVKDFRVLQDQLVHKVFKVLREAKDSKVLREQQEEEVLPEPQEHKVFKELKVL